MTRPHPGGRQPAEAQAHFEHRLAVETDPADVWGAIRDGTVDFTLVDVRAAGAFTRTHLPGAVSLPHGEITVATAAALPAGLLVTYCWGPACNGATRGAAKLAAHGRRVKGDDRRAGVLDPGGLAGRSIRDRDSAGLRAGPVTDLTLTLREAAPWTA